LTIPRILAVAAALALGGAWACGARSALQPPLALERIIPLPPAEGRIDHLAVDNVHGRLFVAELGAGRVEVIDLNSGRSLGRIAGLKEPQGLGYLPATDELAVASGGDGTLRFYRASDLAPGVVLRLGDDADDVRVDEGAGRLVVGYGHALAVIDGASKRILGEVALPAHPEGFEVADRRAFVNLPDAGGVAVVDLASGQVTRWPNQGAAFNFPLALDRKAGLLATIYRLPARLVLLDTRGRRVDTQPTCGDADDVFFDPPRRRLYVVCGTGQVEVFGEDGGGYRSLGRLSTRSGARTGLFVSGPDRLYVAAPGRGVSAPAIFVHRPTP
jgi:DNA-binding beta-propeller fold protein YncE